ncbi:glutamate-rich protein 3 [Seriola dumerili]|nr:glutamate-rich protein 3 [Seriola dumerili]
MSHLNLGLISAYNSLTDRHLTGYFSNTRIRRHLQRAGLITRSGRIVPDKEYRHKLIQRAHQRHVRECLAQAIFHKVLEMERLHQIEIKKKLEEFARRERVHKIKVERSKRYEEDIIRILSPRPPTGARGIRKQHSGPEGEHSESSESPGSSRPNTAPGKMQRPVRLKPIHSNSTTASLRRSSPYRHLESSNENDQLFNCTMDKESRRRLTTVEASHGISPYCLPVINNFVTPVPPATKRKERGVKVTPSSTLRGRRLRPTTASSGADITEDPVMLRSSVHQSRVCVNMVYFGKTVHLSHDLSDMRDEVKVFQQHCGGENLCVYKGKLCEGESFQFISRRHRGFPFSLTFFLNGLQVERLSSCCEFKHRKGSRLGGRHGHFGFSSVEGASPCYKCIIAMGLDKKPTPPPKRVKEEGGREESVTSSKNAQEMETERTGKDAASHSDYERSQRQDMETQVKEERAAEEDKVRDDYEEDFEADDEGPAGEPKEKKSPSPTSETEMVVKERDASETEDDEKDEDIKSRSGSSCSGSDREASDAEATKESREDEKAEQPEEVDQEETVAPPEEKDEPNPEEAAAATEAESAAAKDTALQDSAGDSTEIDISDSSVPSGSENKQSHDTAGDKEAEKTVDEGKQEEGQEQKRGEYKPTDTAVELSPENVNSYHACLFFLSQAKSVQEKLAEAILKESHCSSEPELSDTSTEEEEEEEEEEATDKGHEQNNSGRRFHNFIQMILEETKHEESAGVGPVEGVQDLEETSEPKEQEDETEKQPHENSDSTKTEMVKIDEDDENPASEEAAAEKEKLEDTGADLHPVSEENMTEENKTSEPEEDAAAESNDADTAQKDEENEEKTAEVEEVKPDETGQGAKSSEEDESSVSEPNKTTDETAASDNAEVEEAMTASETMEMKAEPSEEREALSCEEAPVTDTEEKQQADSEDRTEASETEVTAENSSSSLEGSGDTTVEKTADISEDNAKDEGSKDDIKEEEAEEVSAAEASKDGSQQERLGEEQTGKSVEIDDEVEKEKIEEDRETNEEPAEKTLDGQDKVANEERADESEKKEKDEESECVENKNDEEESEAKGAITDKTNEGEEIKETKTDADEEKVDKAENEEEDDNENKAPQSESEKNKNVKESEEEEIIICKTGEEISVMTEEPERNADDVKTSNENTVESEVVGDNEAAGETKANEEMLNNVMECEDVEEETEEAGTDIENGEIDAENGEISTRAESKTHDDTTEASTEDNNDVKAAEHVEDEGKTEEEPAEDESAEVKEVTAESGDDKVDQGPDTDVVESEATEGDQIVEKQDESAQKDSEQETVGTEIKEQSTVDGLNEDRDDREETKDENGNKSDLDNENRDSDSTRNNDNNVHEVIVASSAAQAQSSTPIVLDLGGTNLLDESPAVSDKHPHSDENAAAATAVNLSAAEGENGAEDTEEASKASEEGASVLLKPQAQNNEADNAEEGVATGKETPEALAAEDSTDLVTNWVTMHQTSKFFQTFVEPLEDLKEEASQTQVSISSEEATKSTELPRSESPLKMVKMSENEEEEQMHKDGNETTEKNKVGAVESELESEQTEDGERHENEPARHTLQDKEETEVQELIPKTETEDNEEESTNGQRKGSRGSLEEDKVQDEPTLTQNEISKTEVESIAGTHHSVASGKPESVIENQSGEGTMDNGPDLNEKQTETEEIKGLLPSSKTEEHCEHSASPDGLKDIEETQGKTEEQSHEVTEITDFTTSKSEDGSQEESHNGEIQPKPTDGSINGERRDVQLIQDIKHTLSKDRLSTFSVDETLFGRSSYPSLTAARTESGH